MRSKPWIILIIIIIVLGVGSFVVLQFYNPFRQYPSDGTESPQPTFDQILWPTQPGTKVFSNKGYTLDYSHSDEGYISVKGPSDGTIKKAQITFQDVSYTYDLYEDVYTVLPLQSGNGDYKIRLMKHKEGDTYVVVAGTQISVTMSDPLRVFLYPSQIINYNPETLAISKSFELTKNDHSELKRVYSIYKYIITTIDYDKEKAEIAKTTFILPKVDETLELKKGICFDYAALMAAMLRVQQIPTRVITGYVSVGYHAWVEVYIKDIGWINPSIYFAKEKWERMDPTFDAQGLYFGTYQNKLTY